jgi:sulfite reductase beta subunit-like hemoprotein
MGVAERVRDHLLADPATSNGFAADLGAFGIKVSGCPNSCGQHHIGDIGLTGHSVTDDDGVQRPYYSILAGGSVGEGRGRIGRRIGRFAEEDAPRAIVALARFYARERQPDERFPEFVDRVGVARASEVAAGATPRA